MQTQGKTASRPTRTLYCDLKSRLARFTHVTVDPIGKGAAAARVGRFVFAKLQPEGKQLKISLRLGRSRVHDLRVHYDKDQGRDWGSLYFSPSDILDYEAELLITRAYNFTCWKYLKTWYPVEGFYFCRRRQPQEKK